MSGIEITEDGTTDTRSPEVQQLLAELRAKLPPGRPGVVSRRPRPKPTSNTHTFVEGQDGMCRCGLSRREHRAARETTDPPPSEAAERDWNSDQLWNDDKLWER